MMKKECSKKENTLKINSKSMICKRTKWMDLETSKTQMLHINNSFKMEKIKSTISSFNISETALILLMAQWANNSRCIRLNIKTITIKIQTLMKWVNLAWDHPHSDSHWWVRDRIYRPILDQIQSTIWWKIRWDTKVKYWQTLINLF